MIFATEGVAIETLVPRLVALRRELPDVAIELSIAFEDDRVRRQVGGVVRSSPHGEAPSVGCTSRVAAIAAALNRSRRSSGE